MEASLTRMMTWRVRAMAPTILLLALGFVPLACPLGDGLSSAFALVTLLVSLWAVPCWLILVAAVYQTGRTAFSPHAGLVYAALAVVLTFFLGLGVFVVPLMVRADIQRLLGGPLENSDQAHSGT